jgi:hypothetical protein
MCVKHHDQKGSHPDGQPNARSAACQRRFVVCAASGYEQTADNAGIIGQDLRITVSPTMLFPVWVVSFAVATLGYCYRQRGPCGKCDRGTPGKVGELLASHIRPDRHMPLTG